MRKRKEEKNKSLIVSSFYNFTKTLFNLIFPIITFSYSSRVLGVEGVGKVNFAKSFTTYFTMIAMLGVNYYGTREAAKIRDKKERLNQFAHEMLLINILSTLCSYLLLLGTMNMIPRLQNYMELLVINGVSVFLTGLGMEWLYQALEEYRYITVRTILFQGIALCLMFVFVRSREDTAAYAIICILASHGSYVVNFWHSRKYISFQRTEKKVQIRQHLKPILILFAMAVSIELYTVLDSTMLGFLKGDEAVGLYSAGIKINKITNSLITSIGVVLLPRLSYYIGRKEMDKLNALSRTVYQFIFMMSVPAATGLFILSDDIVLLFSGKEFIAASYTMKLLTPIVVVIPFSIITNIQILIPMGKEKLILLSTCVGAAVNFCCNCLLIPLYAENGAAVATVLAESAVSAVCFMNIRKLFDVKRIFHQYYQYWIATCSILVIGYVVKIYVVNHIMRICAIVVLSVVTYFIILTKMRNDCLVEVFTIVKRRVK